MDCAAWTGVAPAVAKGLLTAVIVASLLVLAQRWGRSAAGLLAGLPTVTGPALLWLALDRGTAFAASASVGAVAGGVCCALFGLAYGLAGRRRGPLGALAAATVASVLPLPWLAGTGLSLTAWFVLATVACAASRWWLAQVVAASSALSIEPARPTGRGWLVTALVSGLVSAISSGAAGPLGPFWAGVLTSPPLLAAAVALELHRQARRIDPVATFLEGYLTGLVGRGMFAALWGLLVQPLGVALAFTVALAVSLLAGRLPLERADATLMRSRMRMRQDS